MAEIKSTNKYRLYRKYKTIGSGTPLPMDEYIAVLVEEGSADCGGIPPQYEFKLVEGSYLCDYSTHIKYELYAKYVSYDSGQTWDMVTPMVTQRGDVIAYDSVDCGYVPPTPIYRWVNLDPSLDYYCSECPSYVSQYLTFVPREASTFRFSGNSVNYSLDDGQTWTTLADNTDSPTVASGNRIMWKATLTPNVGIGTFSSTAKFDVEGNAMSLLYGDNFSGQTSLSGKSHAFYGLFINNPNVVSAENMVLPATTLASECYSDMFSGCTSLTEAPELPATTLADYCYTAMFMGCSSLTTPPELLATTLAYGCYFQMFLDCTSLTTAPTLSATTLTEYCYAHMFGNCTSLTSVQSELPATTLASQCYSLMFEGCTALTTAPELPATTLAEGCYRQMFKDCTSLTTVPSVLPATTLATSCYAYMFDYCTSLTTAPELSATTLASGCCESMFQYSGLRTAPELLAQSLAPDCYNGMFYSCRNLNYIKCLATDISASGCTSSWVTNVASNGTFVKAVCMTSWPSGNSGIPNNWTVIDVQTEDCPAYTLLEGVERKTDYLGRLDLGLSVDTDFKIEVTLMYKNFVGGTFIGIDNTFRWFKATQNSQEKAFFDYNGQRISGLASTYGMENNTIFTLTLENYSMKSDLKTSSVTGSTQTSYTPSGNLCLFSANLTTSGDQGIVYGVKVYTNNASTLIGDFIPVRRNSDNLVTMYNTVTNTFCNVSGILYGVET